VAQAPGTQLSGTSVLFGIVLLAAAGALGIWTGIASSGDVERARHLAQEAIGELPFGEALWEAALRNLHVPAAIAALLAAAGAASIAEGVGFPYISALLRLATGTVVFAAGAALAAWAFIALNDPPEAMQWAARGEELVPGTVDVAGAMLTAVPVAGIVAAFCIVFGAIELWRSLRGFALGARRSQPHDEGDMRQAMQAAAAAARPQAKPKFVELDSGDFAAMAHAAPMVSAAAPAAAMSSGAASGMSAPSATFSADPAVVQAIESMMGRLGFTGSKKLNKQQRAALAALPLQQQETITRFANLVPDGQKVVAIVIGAVILLQVLPSIIAAFVGR